MPRALCLLVVVLVAWPAWAADTGLGRLFFTPAERKALEDARRRNIRAEAQASEKPVRPPVKNVTVTGVVQRSDGETTVWVNGKPVDGVTGDGLKVRATAQQGTVIVHEPDKGHTLRLKVGQRANILTGKIEESYERRAPPAPQAAAPEAAPATAGEHDAQVTSPPAPRIRDDPEDDRDQNPDETGATPGEAGKDERG